MNVRIKNDFPKQYVRGSHQRYFIAVVMVVMGLVIIIVSALVLFLRFVFPLD
jgi:hypothetical protein